MNTASVPEPVYIPEKRAPKRSAKRSANITFVVAFLAQLAVSALSVHSLLEVRVDDGLRPHEVVKPIKVLWILTTEPPFSPPHG